MKAILLLEDGREFKGKLFGHPEPAIGEVCFNTSMSGYQEIITDPSYAGQLVVMSYPIIGNYGTNPKDAEAETPRLAGLVVRECCARPASHRLTMSLDDYTKKHRITAIQGVDTRALVRHIRLKGEMRAAIAPATVDRGDLMQQLRNKPRLDGQDLASAVSTRAIRCSNGQQEKRVVVYDFGVKQNLLRLLGSKATTIVVPADAEPEEVLKLDPDGILLSNGPGDPSAVGYAIGNIEKLIGKCPLLGICLGHQLLALALGGRTFRMKFGHHGGNHPVKELETGKVLITVQNHGFAVEPESIERLGATLSHVNLNDGTLEGFHHPALCLTSYQFHPEAAPGPVDAQRLIERFLRTCQREASSTRC